MFYRHLPVYLYGLTLLPYLLCLGLYGFRSPWGRSPVGRAQLSLYASLTAVLLFAVVAQFADIPPAIRDVLRTITLTGVAITGWFHVKNIVTLQRARRSGEPPRRRADDPKEKP